MQITERKTVGSVTVALPTVKAAPIPHRVAAGTGKRTDHLNKAIKKA